MQYKIPVQIENEDPILLGLSLRQLTIIMIGGGIGYSLFQSLNGRVDTIIAATPAVLITLIAFIIAVFKHSEMTFVPFVLAILRQSINYKERVWVNTVDSFQPIDIGYTTNIIEVKEEQVDFTSKKDKIREMKEKLSKI
jgi:PrgI family protein